MQELCDLKCTACQGGVDPLKGEAIEDYHRQVSEWSVIDEHHLKRTFKFKDFVEALAFVNRVGAVAEEQGHHPNINFTWGRVTIEVFTHKIDGLHANDFILAAQLDRLQSAD